MKKEELKNKGLKFITGGSKWEVDNGPDPLCCPYCGSLIIKKDEEVSNGWKCEKCSASLK